MRALLILVALVGCNRADDRYRSPKDGFAMAKLPGWTEVRERGSVVFHAPEGFGLDDNTIVVRAVPLDQIKPHAREVDGLSRATAAILAGLPSSEVSKASELEVGELEGTRFEASFDPPGKERRYRRSQIALLGASHLFHLMHTAPSEALDQTAADFERVVTTFEEIR